MKAYKTNLTRKLELGPKKKEGFIRIHQENIEQPTEKLLATMNVIDDEDYDEVVLRSHRKRKT